MLLTEAAENPPENRYEMAQIMFEKFKVPASYFSYQPVLDLYSTGRTTGLVLDIGHGVTQAVPIFEGFILSHAVSKMNFGGVDLSEYMGILVKDMFNTRKISSESTSHRVISAAKGFFPESTSVPFGTVGGLKIISKLKENLCSVALDYRKAIENNAETREFILPDRTVITIGSREIFSCPEALFNPGMIPNSGGGLLGVHEQVLKVHSKCDDFAKKLLADNIVLTGGSSMFAGIKPRLQQELNELQKMQQGNSATPVVNLKVDCQRERHHCCWVGGSVLASLSTFKDLWISKTEYDEVGQSIVFTK